MRRLSLSFHDQSVAIICPYDLYREIQLLFGPAESSGPDPRTTITVTEEAECRFSLRTGVGSEETGLCREDLLSRLQDEVVHALIVDARGAVVLHAGAVARDDRAILVAGPTGSGKTSLTGWFVANGYDYLTDEAVMLVDQASKILGFPRAMVVKGTAAVELPAMLALDRAAMLQAGSRRMIRPPAEGVDTSSARKCGLLVFPMFEAGSSLKILPLSAAQTGMKLMECNLNARNLPDEGFRAVTSLARRTPAFVLQYGDFDQLGGVLDTLARLLLDDLRSPAEARRFLTAFTSADMTLTRPTPPKPRFEIHPATPPRPPRRLTIGMATYDDYDGVYFTLQALRLYHPEILDETNFLVIDNHPDGPCAAPLKQLDTMAPNYRYVPAVTPTGTTIRNVVFDEADSEFVLCLDCHVLVHTGAIKRLLDYFEANTDTPDLLQGPLVYDNLDSWSPQFKPGWSAGMYGTWEPDPRADDPDGEPFDIPMQGLGLFACRRDAWLGFNSQFRGFGGEEGYIHQKFRNAGARTLCLPFLRWVHRFNRPLGVPYPNRWEDRIRNYLVGFREVGLPIDPMIEHFRELLGREEADRIVERVEAELAEA